MSAEQNIKIALQVEREVRTSKVFGFSVDPEGTREVDQTMWCERTDEGGYVVTIALADPTSFVERNSQLERSARHKGVTFYGGKEMETIFPQSIGIDEFSLQQGKTQPCVLVELEFDKDKRYNSIFVGQGLVENVAEMTYERAEQRMFDPADPIGGQLVDLLAVAVELKKDNEIKYAVDIDRGILVTGERIVATDADELNSNQIIVRELFKLMNNKLAELCEDYEKRLYYLHRHVYMFGLDAKHAAKFSAPIRRYADYYAHMKLLELINPETVFEEKTNMVNICGQLTGRRNRSLSHEPDFKNRQFLQEMESRNNHTNRWRGNPDLEELVGADNELVHAKVVDRLKSAKISKDEIIALELALLRNPQGWEDIAELVNDWKNKHPKYSAN